MGAMWENLALICVTHEERVWMENVSMNVDTLVVIKAFKTFTMHIDQLPWNKFINLITNNFKNMINNK